MTAAAASREPGSDVCAAAARTDEVLGPRSLSRTLSLPLSTSSALARHRKGRGGRVVAPEERSLAWRVWVMDLATRAAASVEAELVFKASYRWGATDDVPVESNE